MRDGDYSAPSPARSRRRTRVKGAQWTGIYERVGRDGSRVLEVDYFDHDGRRRWQTLPPGSSLKQAKAAREQLHVKRAQGERFAPTRVPTLSEFAEQWLAEQVGMRGRTREKYDWALRHHIRPAVGRRKVNAIDVEDVAALVRGLTRKGMTPSSIRSVLSVLSRLLHAAARRKLRTANPVRELERDEVPRAEARQLQVLDARQVGKLVRSTPEEWRALVGVLAYAGLRVSEALGLTWADVDVHGRLLRVEAQLERKSGLRTTLKTGRSRRHVPITAELASLLAAHKLRKPERLKQPVG
jgi:integrase